MSTEPTTYLALYAVAHMMTLAIDHALRVVWKHLKHERDHIIKSHVKDGHTGRLSVCLQDKCLSLRKKPVLQPATDLNSAS